MSASAQACEISAQACEIESKMGPVLQELGVSGRRSQELFSKAVLWVSQGLFDEQWPAELVVRVC